MNGVLDLCRAYGGPLPYGPGIRWNGSSWVAVDCSKRSAITGSTGGMTLPTYQNAFTGDVLDGSADASILPIDVPRATTPPNVLPPGGSVGVPVVDAEDAEDAPCACEARNRSIFWLLGVGMLLWLI